MQVERPESPAEQEHRLRAQARAEDHERRKDFILFSTTVAMCVAAVAGCLWLLLRPDRDPDDVAWAAPLLTLILGGFAGRYTAMPRK